MLDGKCITAVPLNIAVEKVRGFIADNKADVIEIGESRLILGIDGKSDAPQRRKTDRATPFLIELDLREISWDDNPEPETQRQRTIVQVTIRPKRKRDRRHREADERARRLLASLKSYLIAQDYDRLGK